MSFAQHMRSVNGAITAWKHAATTLERIAKLPCPPGRHDGKKCGPCVAAHALQKQKNAARRIAIEAGGYRRVSGLSAADEAAFPER